MVCKYVEINGNNRRDNNIILMRVIYYNINNNIYIRRDKAIIKRLRIDHIRLTYGYLMKKLMLNSSRTELSINNIIIECLQYADALNNLNIPNALDAAQGSDKDTITPILKFLNIT